MNYSNNSIPQIRDSLNEEGIPSELKPLQQWVTMRLELDAKGKPTKVPRNTYKGYKAAVNNPETFGSYNSAVSGYRKFDNLSGIGFVFTDKDPYCGIDLDKCRNVDTGEVEEWALDIVRRVNSYTEISISGKELPKIAMVALKSHKAKQAKEKLSAGEAYKDKDLVFCTTLGGPFDPNHFRQRFKRILCKAGLPAEYRLHELRHTHTTQLLMAGVNAKVVQERLGHSDIETTMNIYAHTTKGMQKEAADMIETILKASKRVGRGKQKKTV